MSLFRPRQPAQERRDFVSSATIPSNAEGYYNTSGRSVTTESALRLAAVYGAVSIISDSLSTTPIDTFRKRGDLREELPTPSLLDLPSGDLEPVEWLGSLFNSALLRGNVFGFKDNLDDLGYPREIHLIHPDEASVMRRSAGNPEPVYRFNGEEVPRRRVFHLKGFTMPGALEGLSPIGYFAQTIGMGLAAEDFGARFYGDNGHPTAVLQTEQQVTQEQAQAIKARLMNSIRGRREPIVLGAGVEWKSIQVPPNESQFLDAMKFSALEIANMIYHVPASLLGIPVEGTSLTYSNREQDEILLQSRALQHWAVRFEQHISRLLPGKQYVRFNMDAAVRSDITTRYKAHEIALGKKPWKLVDEVRALEDAKPLTPAQREELNPTPPPPVAPPATEEETDE